MGSNKPKSRSPGSKARSKQRKAREMALYAMKKLNLRSKDIPKARKSPSKKNRSSSRSRARRAAYALAALGMVKKKSSSRKPSSGTYRKTHRSSGKTVIHVRRSS